MVNSVEKGAPAGAGLHAKRLSVRCAILMVAKVREMRTRVGTDFAPEFDGKMGEKKTEVDCFSPRGVFYQANPLQWISDGTKSLAQYVSK